MPLSEELIGQDFLLFSLFLYFYWKSIGVFLHWVTELTIRQEKDKKAHFSALLLLFFTLLHISIYFLNLNDSLVSLF